jgi:hypothetical protein
MGFRFYSIDSLPDHGDIVWCKWPYREDKSQPGIDVRPVLVRARRVNRNSDGTEYGSLMVSYGTGVIAPQPTNGPIDLIIGKTEFRALGLHKPTLFSLNPAEKKHLPWCSEYFVCQQYLVEQEILIGRLNLAQKERLKGCLRRRGIEPT